MQLIINVAIDDSSRVFFPCLRKLKKKNTLEENLAAATEEAVKNHADFGNNSKPREFVPSFASTPTQAVQASISEPTTYTSSSSQRMFLSSHTP